METQEPAAQARSYELGPPLPAELLKPPFTPGAAGRIAFFFGPAAGAFVCAISLRRMRHPEKARKVTTLAMLAAIALATILFFIPDAFSRIVGLAAEALFYITFQKIQEREFADWQAANATLQPSSGWKAIGWGILGLCLYVTICVVVFVLLSLFGFGMR